MKILILTNLYPPYAIGGYEIAAFEVANMLQKNGHQVAILTSNYDKRVLGDHQSNIEVVVYRRLFLLDSWYGDYEVNSIQNNQALNTRLTNDVIGEFKPDLVYAWNQANLGPEPLIAIEKKDIPIVHHLMSAEILMYAKSNVSWKYRAKRFLRDLLDQYTSKSYLGVKHFKNIIFISDFIKLSIETNHILPDKSCVIYPSIDVDEILQKKFYELTDNKIRIVFLGQVARHKGVSTLVNSLLTILQKVNFNIDLTIYGGGDSKLTEEVLSHANERLNIKITGMISKLDIYQNLKNFDIGIFPSEWDEPFGISQIEMMCAGLPIISSGRGGSTEPLIGGMNALLFDSGDSDSLSDQIMYLANHYNEVAEKLGKNARNDVLNNFNPHTINRKIISFIKSVANEN